jgi:hypothetical protein
MGAAGLGEATQVRQAFSTAPVVVSRTQFFSNAESELS